MSIEEARQGLQAAALAYAADRTPGNARALEEEAVQFRAAQLAAAAGIPAAIREANEEKRRGVRLCPSCMQVKVVWASNSTGGRYVDPKTMQPHWCKR